MTSIFDFLGLNPRRIENTVFKYLKYDGRAHQLRGAGQKGLIACTARTGSSLVQVALERYRLNVQEYFNPEGGPKAAVQSGEVISLSDYANLLARTAISGEWFIVKGGIVAFLFLYYLGELPEFSSDWRVIYLRRRNVIRQAISMEIAAMTNQWTIRMPKRRPVEVGDYSFESLFRQLQSVLAENEKWERAFRLLGREPYRLFYEDFVLDVSGETERIAQFLEIDTKKFPEAREHVPWLERQSTEINSEWERRFTSELSERLRNRCLPSSSDMFSR